MCCIENKILKEFNEQTDFQTAWDFGSCSIEVGLDYPLKQIIKMDLQTEEFLDFSIETEEKIAVSLKLSQLKNLNYKIGQIIENLDRLEKVKMEAIQRKNGTN